MEVAPRYRGAVREKVPLPQAWGYVLGLVLFAVGGALAVMNRFRIRGAGGGALEALALGALFFTMSGGLVSSFSAVVVTGVFVGAPVALYFAVQNGRTPLVFFWLLVLFSVSALAWLR